MDAMALLCTLHADGPTTLAQLRASGLSNLDAIESEGAERIAEVLGVPPAQARRFVREAHVLRDRLDVSSDGLDVEDANPAAPSGMTGIPGAIPVSQEPVESELSRLSPRDRKLVDKVLNRWRDEPPTPTTNSAENGPARAADPRALVPGRVDGLSLELAAVLAQAGVTTLDELQAADALVLSQIVGQPYSTLRRLQFLARKEAAGPPPASISPAPRPRLDWNAEITPATPPVVREEDAGGPFAE